MHNLEWSRAEKAVAHAAFRAALAREMASIRDEVEAMFQRSADPFDIWDVHDFLSTKRRAIDEKYDYRYSVLILVFGRLLHEGWARESELDGLSAEKMELIRRVLAFARERDGASAPDQERLDGAHGASATARSGEPLAPWIRSGVTINSTT